MIVFEVLPNENLKKTIAYKMSPALIVISHIPAYWLFEKETTEESEKKRFVSRVVKKGDTGYIVKKALKQISKAIGGYKEEIIRYLQKHLDKNEALNVALTLYFFDKEKGEYAYLRKEFGMEFDGDFVAMLEKPKKHKKKSTLFEFGMTEASIDLYKILQSDRYEPITHSEYAKHYLAENRS